MTKKRILRILIIILSAVAAAFLVQLAYRMSCRLEKTRNHTAIMTLVDEDITYEDDTIDSQLEELNRWIAKKNIYDADRGRLYERVSLVYSAKGDEINYYQNLGYALFYLGKGDDLDYTVNIYLDLVSFYIRNDSYDHAAETMDTVHELTDLDAIENLQVKSYAYRLDAIINDYRGNYEEAEADLDTALNVINQSNTGIYEDAYRAMIAAVRARVYYHEGKNDEAWEILKEYEDSELFTQEVYASVLARDFIIPYYETKCYLSVFFQDNDQTKIVIDTFIDYCEKYDYPQIELNTLITLMEKYPPSDEETKEAFYASMNKAYLSASNISSDNYTSLVSSQVAAAKSEIENTVEEKQKVLDRAHTYAFGTALLGLLIAVIIMILKTSKRDGLTSVNIRKSFNQDLAILKRRGNNYLVIMMDIDNFKSVNDTYGHQSGDKVLSELGLLLKSLQTKNCIAYRYGGEEFVILLMHSSMNQAKIIAEQVRSGFEALKWDFTEQKITLSLGVAEGAGKDDVVKLADDRLYYSKQHGKNQVTATDSASD